MNLRTYSSLVALTLAGLATPALADQDGRSFTGPYIAVSGGLSTTDNKTDDRVVFDTNRDGAFGEDVFTSTGANAFSPGSCRGSSILNSPATPCDRDHDDVAYAVRLGYDGRIGNAIAGGILIEASKNDSTDSVTAFSTTPAGYSFTRGIDYAVSIRGRIGFAPGDRGLIYVTAGPSYARIKHGFTTTNTANSFTAVNPDKMMWGGQVGGGAEIMLGGGLSLGMEYLYNRYHDDKYYVAIGNGTAGPTNPFVLAGGVNARPSGGGRYDFHTFSAVLGFHF
jgi:outer membrane immunogenic protein